MIAMKTYADTRSLGTSGPNASAISNEPIFAMQCNARLTCTGFGEEISFLMFCTINLIKSECAFTNTEMNK